MFSLQTFFPFLAIAISWLAWHDPQPLLPWNHAVVPLLMLVMFIMGMTLRLQDFQRILKKPEPVATGVVLQFLLMPLIAWALSHLLALPQELAVGLILLGCCAGGTASNVISFLAGGDLALSVSMTLLSTLWGVALTPWLLVFYAGDQIQVDNISLLLSLIQLTLLPVAAGLLFNHWLPDLRRAISQYLANAATIVILAIIAIVVAQNADDIATLGITALLAVVLHNLTGLTLGYWLARWRGLTEVECRTIAIEVGMQNSGLAAALAIKFFGPVSALPAALFSVCHNVSGSLLAGYWRWRTSRRIRQIRSKTGIAPATPFAPDQK
jgi:bile acid:Na+ symporter, BASS family